MTRVLKPAVMDALLELADEAVQRRLWVDYEETVSDLLDFGAMR
jgi:hypothetical protein